MTRLRLLVLEDQRPDAELILHALHQAGFDCEWTLATSKEELTRALSPDLDVILSDFSLPGFTALGALDLLRERQLDVPLIVVTVSHDEDTAAECFKRGAFDYIVKDHPARLGPAINRLLEHRRLVAERREIERRHATLWAAIEHSAATVLITRADGTIEYVNPQFTAVTGYSSAEAVGRTPRILKSGLQPPEFYADLWRTILSGREWRGELANRKKSGELYWEQASISPVLDSSGAITHFVAVKDDITDRRRASEALRVSEERYRGLVESQQDLIVRTDLDGRFTFVNDAYCEKFGLIREEALAGKTFQPLVHPDDLARTIEVMKGLFAPPYRVVLEQRCFAVEGTRWVEWEDSAIRDSSGQVVEIQAIGRDVTARKMGEASLREIQARTEFALAAARMGIWEADWKSDQLTWSATLATIFGLAPPQSPTTNEQFFELIHPEDRDAVREATERAIRERSDLVNEFRVVWPDGTVHWIAGHARVLVDAAGSATGMIGVGIDITERKSLEDQFRQSQRMEAIGQLAGGVAHDFNNLLTAIIGYANLVSSALEPGDPKLEDVDEIIQAADRAAVLTRQLLAFSRKQVLRPRLVDLNDTVADTVKMLRRMIPEHIELTPILAPELRPTRVDPAQLEQVVMNLVVNARDAMPSGGLLTIETAMVDLDEAYARQHVPARPGRYVMLTVSDTGIGMDATTLRRIFEPFFTTKEQGRGTGLGLATVYGIVNQSGGNIWVYSEPNRGSTFKVYLPAAEGSADRELAIGTEGPAVGSETILVVEDETAVRHLTRAILERAGYNVHDAADPIEAEALFAELTDAVDLLITDVVMPGSDGPAMYQRFAQRRPGLKVLFMSGYTDASLVRNGILDSTSGFTILDKPFTARTLTRTVREVLDR
jgi:two-component system, cell cycle sensor histidine kinase and response regulator CckA